MRHATLELRASPGIIVRPPWIITHYNGTSAVNHSLNVNVTNLRTGCTYFKETDAAYNVILPFCLGSMNLLKTYTK